MGDDVAVRDAARWADFRHHEDISLEQCGSHRWRRGVERLERDRPHREVRHPAENRTNRGEGDVARDVVAGGRSIRIVGDAREEQGPEGLAAPQRDREPLAQPDRRAEKLEVEQPEAHHQRRQHLQPEYQHERWPGFADVEVPQPRREHRQQRREPGLATRHRMRRRRHASASNTSGMPATDAQPVFGARLDTVPSGNSRTHGSSTCPSQSLSRPSHDDSSTS